MVMSPKNAMELNTELIRIFGNNFLNIYINV